MARRSFRFAGRIAGFGTASGTRLVVGDWAESPFGAFTDVMLEDAGGVRTLLAPSDEVRRFVAATYRFDRVEVVPFERRVGGRRMRLVAGGLEVDLEIGARSGLGLLVHAVPSPLAVAPAWLRAIDPVARTLVQGVGTAGSAGSGRREYYGVTDARSIASASATLDGSPLGELRDLDPPVRFGFASAPRKPHIVDVVTTITERR